MSMIDVEYSKSDGNLPSKSLTRGCYMFIACLYRILLWLVFFFFLSFLHVLRLCATLWVMTDLLSVLYVHFLAWHKAPLFYYRFCAFLPHFICGLWAFPPDSCLFYWLISKLVFSLLIILSLPFQLFSFCSVSIWQPSYLSKIAVLAWMLVHLPIGCHLISSWPNSLFSFLCSLPHLWHSV